MCVCAPAEIYCNVSREADCKQRALRLIDWPNYNKTTLGYHSNRSINKEPLSSDAHTHTVVYSIAIDYNCLLKYYTVMF